MIYDNLDFHNIAEMNEADGLPGLRLQRVPENVRQHLDDGTAGTMLSPSGGEIRFRIKDGCDSATITLSAELPTTIYIYHGPFQGGKIQLDKEPCDYKVVPNKRVTELTREDNPGALFDPGLVRLCFGEDYPEPVRYHGHSGEVCLPQPGDTPDKLYLSYGSSITHGTGLSGAALSYPAHAAWKMGVDIRNLGASGCCLCEPAMADFLAEQDCDLMTLELSVNMLGRGIDAAEFRKRASYLVERVTDSNPRRPVVCITIFPHYHDIAERYYTEQITATSDEYRQVLRDIVSELDRPNLSLIEGPDLLQNIGGLSADLIHPGVRGMIQIGEELAQRITEAGLID